MTDVITTLAAIGIDLGDKDAHYACVNEEGKFTEEGTFAMTPAGVRKHFAKIPRSRIAIEAGAQSRWIAKTLGEFGHEVIVANPRQLQLISANYSKNDSNDAKILAKLARVDASLLSPLQHRGEKEQTTLLSIRARAQLVKTRVALMHSCPQSLQGAYQVVLKAMSTREIEIPHLKSGWTLGYCTERAQLSQAFPDPSEKLRFHVFLNAAIWVWALAFNWAGIGFADIDRDGRARRNCSATLASCIWPSSSCTRRRGASHLLPPLGSRISMV